MPRLQFSFKVMPGSSKSVVTSLDSSRPMVVISVTGVLKHRSNWETFRPAVAPKASCVKEAKKKKSDMLKLLKELQLL